LSKLPNILKCPIFGGSAGIFLNLSVATKMRKISLNEKLVVYFVIIGVSGIFIVSAFAYYNSRQALLNRTFDQLTSVRVNKKKQVEAFFYNRLHDVGLMASTNEICQLAQQIHNTPETVQANRLSASAMNEYLFSYLKKSGYFSRLILLERSGANLIMQMNEDSVYGGFSISGHNTLVPENIVAAAFGSEVKIHDIVVLSETQQPVQFISAPVSGTQNEIALLLEISLSEISCIMLENNPEDGLGQSGESYIAGCDTLMRSQSRFQAQSVLQTFVNTTGFQEAKHGNTGIAVIDDYRGIEVLSSFSPLDIPGLDWIILAEIDVVEAMSPVNGLRSKLLIIGLLNLILIFGFAFYLSRRITSPIIRLNKAAGNIGTGSFSETLPISSNDEIGELTETFNKMVLQLKQQKEALAEERKIRLRSMIDGQEKERQRLSRDLHDGLGQSLIAIKLQLESFCDGVDQRQNERMAKIKQYFEQTIDDIRRMSNDLAPSVLDTFGLTTALRYLCRELSLQSGITILFEHTGHSQKIAKNTSIYLYRICQEALSNAIKHAQATQIEVMLNYQEKTICLQVKDNGNGFDLEKTKKCHGNGISNIQERTQLLNALLQIITAPGKGTRIRFECKMKNQ